MKSVIVGTAGHIDHGKTALVKALTGIDADRLEEEKRRGITIDIGFAHLELPAPDGETIRLGFVDVPGHERFVRNMLAGAGGMDVVLLVIAADQSIQPQTREHFDICRLLSVRRGITVLTKSDSVDRETLQVVRLEVEEFLRESFLDPHLSPIVAVSSRTGAGLDHLKQVLARVASETPTKDASAIARLPIDRVFTMKGFGTVVTGTLISGSIGKEQQLEVFPGGQRVRVRAIQVHGRATEQAVAGERTALNLAGVARESLVRGMTLAPPSTLQSTSRIDVSLTLLPSAKPLKDRARVHFHASTMQTVATLVLHGKKVIAPGEQPFAQLRFAKPVLLLPGERFIVRQFSPVATIGGGVVLDAAPLLRAGASGNIEKLSGNVDPALSQMLQFLSSGNSSQILLFRVGRRGSRGLPIGQAVAETGWPKSAVEELARQLVQDARLARFANHLFSSHELDLTETRLLDQVTKFHGQNPLSAGVGRGELLDRVQRAFETAPVLFEAALASLERKRRLTLPGELVQLHGQGVVMKDEEAESKDIIERSFASAGLKVPALKEVLAGLRVDQHRAQKIVTLLLRDKVLIKISDELVFHRRTLEDLRKQLSAEKMKAAKIDVARFKDLTGVSRKYAIPLLEYLDREHVTRRVGNDRVIL